jgi:hypothetical protein
MIQNKIMPISPAKSFTKKWNINEKHDNKRDTTTKNFLPQQSTNNTIKYGNNTIDDKHNKRTMF